MEREVICPECGEAITRREFLKAAGGVVVAASLGAAAGAFPACATPRLPQAAKTLPRGTPESVEEALRDVEESGGLEAMHLAFYKQDDLGNDGIWDIWRLEGPAFVWHFRGAPHVHVWVNIGRSKGVQE